MINNLAIYSIEEAPDTFDELLEHGKEHCTGSSSYLVLQELLDTMNQGMRWTLNEFVYLVNLEKREILSHVQK